MTRRLLAIGLIFAAVSAARMLLSGSIVLRTNNADSGLRAGVQSPLGSEQQGHLLASESMQRHAVQPSPVRRDTR